MNTEALTRTLLQLFTLVILLFVLCCCLYYPYFYSLLLKCLNRGQASLNADSSLYYSYHRCCSD